MTQFSALQTARSVRTRRLAAAEENIEVARAARLAQVFKEICDGIISYKGEVATSPSHTVVTLTCDIQDRNKGRFRVRTVESYRTGWM